MNLPPDANFGAKKPRTPAPRIDPVFLWPTPNHEDYLFYVERNGDLPTSRDWEYGTPHPDKGRYPNHKLVYVSPQTEDKWSRWYYASNRIEEDEYNWSFTDADIGGTRFRAVARIYIIPREEFVELEPAMGTVMPDVPKDLFQNNEETFQGQYVLALRSQVEVPDEILRSIYVFEQRTYVKRCTITTIQTEDFFGIGGAKVDTWYYRGELVEIGEEEEPVTVESLFADTASTFWGWQEDGSQRDGTQISDNWFIISVINSITDAIDGYSFSYPSFASINLPRRLTGSEVTFNVAKSEGNQDQDGWFYEIGTSISGSLGLTDSCSSSVSISPEVGLTFFEPNGSYLPSTVYVFFLPENFTWDDLLTKVSELHETPVTRYQAPDTATALITLISSSASVRCSATAAFSAKISPSNTGASEEKSVSSDKSVSQSTQFLQISGVAGEFPSLAQSQSDSVVASAAIAVYGTGGFSGLGASAFIEDSAEVTASIQSGGSDTVLNPGSSNGSFVVRINVDPYMFDRAKVFVEVVDLP